MFRIPLGRIANVQHRGVGHFPVKKYASVPHRTFFWQPVRTALIASSTHIVEGLSDARLVIEDIVLDTAADLADAAVPYLGTFSSVAWAKLEDFYEMLVERTGYDPDLDSGVTPPTNDPFESTGIPFVGEVDSSSGFFTEILRPIKSLWNTINPARFVGMGIVALAAKSGLPMWAVIISGTFCVRLLTWPLTLMQARAAARKVHSTAEMERLTVQERAAANETDPIVQKEKQDEIKQRKKAVDKKYRTEFWRMTIGLFIYSPILLCMTGGIRKAVRSDPTALTGGFGWIRDLSCPDVYLLLPTSMVVGWVYFAVRLRGNGTMPPALHVMAVPLVVAIAPFAVWFMSSMPAGPLLYLSTSFSITLILNRVRRM